ncbi:NUDIX domain-containing protein [Arthrobacter sp. H5]|uniref:NUDIX hydrolase n=1 Tax=Arthrobacter sp. H5 TaxID=1267973 RepID=UPI0004B68D31|nr:NUDIX domain-containing protein [Arthrobacter sp. H5]
MALLQSGQNDAGTSLEQYPRPSVAVDTAVLTVSDGRLSVLLVTSAFAKNGWTLPGTFLHPGERLADAVLRSLRDKAGVTGHAPRQLYVFDDPARDPRGWVLSVAHVDVVPEAQLAEALEHDGVRLAPVEKLTGQPNLPFDHPIILAKALEWVRAAYAEHPDPGGLLAEPFTLRQLRAFHEVIAGQELMRDTFRRLMEPQLEATRDMSDGGRGRPSRLFARPTLFSR